MPIMVLIAMPVVALLLTLTSGHVIHPGEVEGRPVGGPGLPPGLTGPSRYCRDSFGYIYHCEDDNWGTGSTWESYYGAGGRCDRAPVVGRGRLMPSGATSGVQMQCDFARDGHLTSGQTVTDIIWRKVDGSLSGSFAERAGSWGGTISRRDAGDFFSSGGGSSANTWNGGGGFSGLNADAGGGYYSGGGGGFNGGYNGGYNGGVNSGFNGGFNGGGGGYNTASYDSSWGSNAYGNGGSFSGGQTTFGQGGTAGGYSYNRDDYIGTTNNRGTVTDIGFAVIAGNKPSYGSGATSGSGYGFNSGYGSNFGFGSGSNYGAGMNGGGVFTSMVGAGPGPVRGPVYGLGCGGGGGGGGGCNGSPCSGGPCSSSSSGGAPCGGPCSYGGGCGGGRRCQAGAWPRFKRSVGLWDRGGPFDSCWVDSRPNFSTLVLAAPQPSDAGVYRCLGRLSGGAKSYGGNDVVSMEVQYTPEGAAGGRRFMSGRLSAGDGTSFTDRQLADILGSVGGGRNKRLDYDDGIVSSEEIRVD